MFRRIITACLFIYHSTSNALPDNYINIVTEHLPPYQIKGTPQVTGFATEIVQKAMKYTGLPYAINIYPWTRAYNKALELKNTCIYSMARTKEREHLFHWLQPIATTSTTLIGLHDNNIVINSIDDAKKYQVAVLKDDVTHQILLNAGFIENLNLYVVNNTQSLLKLLIHRNAINLVLIDINTLKYRAQHDKLSPQLFKPYLTVTDKPLDYYFACSLSTSEEMMTEINESLNKIKRNGEYQTVMDEWQITF